MYQKNNNVLLLGNGILRAYSSSYSWNKLIEQLRNEYGQKEGIDLNKADIPMPLKIVIATDDNIDSSIRSNLNLINKPTDKLLRTKLKEIIDIGFDDILTTNYGYEIESAIVGKDSLTDSYLKKHTRNISKDIARVQSKYLINTCNIFETDAKINRVWHIHGEVRKPSSIIIGHYYYGILLKRIIDYLDHRHSDYRDDNSKYVTESWIDAFIKGDVYILGFGLDFSEMDLWWLINRKKRETSNHGKTRYFTFENEPEKHALLRSLGVEVYDYSKDNIFDVPYDVKDENYRSFYDKSVKDIRKIIE